MPTSVILGKVLLSVLLKRGVGSILDRLYPEDLEQKYRGAIREWARSLPPDVRISETAFYGALSATFDSDGLPDTELDADSAEALCSQEAWEEALGQYIGRFKKSLSSDVINAFFTQAPEELDEQIKALSRTLARIGRQDQHIFQEVMLGRTPPQPTPQQSKESALQREPESAIESIRSVFAMNGYQCGAVVSAGSLSCFDTLTTNDPFATAREVILCPDAPSNPEAVVLEIASRAKGGTPPLIICDSPELSKLLAREAHSAPVMTRASISQRFESFAPYMRVLLDSGEIARELTDLNNVYQEVRFDDQHGRDIATAYLRRWRDGDLESDPSWVLVTGEYGTGKTALTKVIQYRWLREYRDDRSHPVPIRIELREFRREFSAEGLLAHFLRRSNMYTFSVPFLRHLLGSGRAVLLLDGYDEMAQYMSPRERRGCLIALAELGADGARGLITGRPNYFTDSDELRVLESLYRRLESDPILAERGKIQEERRYDELLKRHVVQRHERKLNDLSNEQIRSLIDSRIPDNPGARDALISLLERVDSPSDTKSKKLSNRPVIVSLLIELATKIRRGGEDPSAGVSPTPVEATEWGLYSYIVDELMLRDYEQRTREIAPADRRKFLTQVAWEMTTRRQHKITLDNFQELVAEHYRLELDRLPTDERRDELERRTADLRSSGLLSADDDRRFWFFSHSSLREFLVTTVLVKIRNAEDFFQKSVPVTDAMASFARSGKVDDQLALRHALRTHWFAARKGGVFGSCVALLWPVDTKDGWHFLAEVSSGSMDCGDVTFSRITLGGALTAETKEKSISFRNATFEDCVFKNADLRKAVFEGARFSSTSFVDCDLRGARFDGALLMDVSFDGCELAGADFRKVAPSEISIDTWELLSGNRALGFLHSNGALVPDVPGFNIYEQYTAFDAIYAVSVQLSKNSVHQRRGIEDRGGSAKYRTHVKDFITYAIRQKLLKKGRTKELLEVTSAGRDVFATFSRNKEIPPPLLGFFEKTFS